MPVIAFLAELFPAHLAPWTLNEITIRIQAALEPGITYSRVHHAFDACREDVATAEIVRPLSTDGSEMQFSAEAAQRIARKAISRKVKQILVAKSKQSESQVRNTASPA